MSATIHLLEDDADVARVFSRALTNAGFKVRRFGRIADCAAALDVETPDLALIDLGLPDGDGLALISDALGRAKTPVIVVSGRDALDAKLQALEDGADDYLVKPVDPLELVARARALLRRAAEPAAGAQATTKPTASGEKSVAAFAGWRADFATFTLTDPDGVAELMTAAEARLLQAFLEAPGRVLTRAALLDVCAPTGDEAFDRAIDVRVSRLRKKLRDDPRKPAHIKTVYGAGYVFASKVDWER